MYRSISILQLVDMSNIQRSLSLPSWIKEHLIISGKSTKKLNLKVTIFTAWISSKLNQNLWIHILLTLIQFMSQGAELSKLLSFRSEVNVRHQTVSTTIHAILHCSSLNRASRLSWISLCLSLFILNTFPTLWNIWKLFKMYVTSLEGTAFPATRSVLF